MARTTWGNIRKKGNSWEVSYLVGTKRKYEYCETRKEAERLLSERRVQLEDAVDSMTLDAFWRLHYLPEITEELAPSTVVGYKRLYEHDVKPAYGDLDMREIRPRAIQKTLDQMTKGTAKHFRALMSSILGRAFAMEYVDDNVMRRRYKMPKAINPNRGRTKDVYSPKELDWIFDRCAEEPWEAAFILSAFGGASRSEAMGVKVGEIEEKDGCAVVTIERTVHRLDGMAKAVDRTKNEYRNDVVVVPPPYAERLLDIQHNAELDGWTWLTDDGMGDPMCPDRMAASFKRWFLDKEMRFIPFSNLRNAYATNLHASGVDGYMVSKMMRHSQPSTTYKHYDRPSVETRIKVVKAS